MVERRALSILLFWFPVLWLVIGCTGYVTDGSPDGISGGNCGDTLSSPVNCGRCGNACSAEQICDVGACRARTAGCSSGRLLCGSSCIDGQTDANNCGMCGRACGANRTCSAGTCVCASGAAVCGDACADLQTDSNHCGACNVACTNGRSCQAGMCVCPTNRIVCGDACADTQSDPAHCGGCNMACAGGQICTSGQCMCPAGQQLCGTSCVDTQANDAHCGMCNLRCELGETCAAGMCGGGGLGEDMCTGLAQNLTIEQIAVYQAVKIAIMEGNGAIDTAERNADVVAGRDAMFRVFVTVGAGWTARQLSARIFVENGDVVDSYFAKQTISETSSDADTMSSFQIVVPKDKITADTRYAVEVVECATGSGGVQSPRFPAMDGVALGARETGLLKVHIIPIQANGMGPDTSDAGLQLYEELLLAMYPITGLELTVGAPFNAGYPIDWNGLLGDIRALREEENPADDVYYYGLLRPTDTLQQFCGGGCTAGIGYVAQGGGGGGQLAAARAAVGIGFGDNASAETMAHELGHNHGRNHAPCVQGGSIEGVDGNYPYEGASLGAWGYDSRDMSFLDPEEGTDIMSYCDDQWVSDYTYRALVDRVAEVNGAPLFVYTPPEALKMFHVLLVDGASARWGKPHTRPSLPSGLPEPAEIFDASGQLLGTIEVYRTEVADIDASSIQVPAPEPGWHAVKVRGANALPFVP